MNPLPDWSMLTLAKAALASGIAFFLGLSAAIQALAGLMVLDLITGVMVGFDEKSLNSSRGARGVTKKAGMVGIIIGLNIATYHLQSKTGIGLPVDLGNWVTWFYVITELISVVENCGKLGAPVPQGLQDALRKARDIANTQGMIDDVKAHQQDAVHSLEKAQEATDVLSADVQEKSHKEA